MTGSKKEGYEPPELTEYGSVSALTEKGGRGEDNFNDNAAASGTPPGQSGNNPGRGRGRGN